MWYFIKQSDFEWIETIQNDNLVKQLVCQYESGRPMIRKSWERLNRKYSENQ